jgi:hypothetical protein
LPDVSSHDRWPVANGMNPIITSPVFLILLASTTISFAQQSGVAPAASTAEQHAHQADNTAIELFPARDASGTAWLPDETPMYAAARKWGKWQIMLHGNGFLQFLYEPGDVHRTGGFANQQLSSANWGMAIARRPLRTGRVGLRAMMSIEPWTVADCGFINLLANGEMCEGDTIHDRQHPHDLFMELAADYDRPIRGPLRWQLYAGLAGEPALGPAGFPHRLSAMPNPIAPITHHWLDSSHITFGLITTGLYDRRWKAEISVFNGREPDEARADFDLGPLDSISGRLTFLPTPRVSFQVSAGHLHAAKSEFAPQPRSDIQRATASATYHRLRDDNVWATTIAYGVNAGREVIPDDVVDLVTQAFLVESSFTQRERHTWFGRVEAAGKPGEDLHVHEAPATVFGVAKVQAGYALNLWTGRGIVAGIGGTVSISIVPSALTSRYPGRIAPGFGVFFNVRPSRHVM